MATVEAVECGEVRPDELDAMLGIMCEAFGLPFAAAREIFYDDPYFDVRNKRVLRVGGRVVSCLTIVETACWIGRSVVSLAGIAGVATLPKYRRKGYAGRLLEETLHLLEAREAPLSALFPFSYDYYRQYGWELAGVAHRSRIAPARLPAYPEARSVRLIHEEDIPFLERLYTAQAQEKTLHCLRDAKRWKFILEHVKQRVVYAPDGNRVEGYLLYEHRPGRMERIVPPVHTPATLRILEMSASTPAARRGLLGHLAAQTNVGAVEYASTLEGLAETGLLEPAGAIQEETTLATVETVPAIMTRVVDFQRLIAALLPQWESWEGSLTLMARETAPDAPTKVVVLERGRDGTLDCRSEQASLQTAPGANRLEGDIRTWAQVVVGHISGEDALALGLLTASTSFAAALAATLFPHRTPFLPAPDAF